MLVVGAGGLGSPALLYLAAAGVGTLGVVDDDVVDTTNLQRQVLHGDADVGRAKTASAADAVRALNPDVRVVEHRVRLDADNALDVLADYDVVLDGADNLPTRYLVGDACARLGTAARVGLGLPVRRTGQRVVRRARAPATPASSRRCRPPTPCPSCSTGGVLGSVCASIGSVMATEAVKLITGIGEPLVGRLLVHDAMRQRWSEVAVRAAPGCPVCGPDADPRRPLGAAPVRASVVARSADGSGHAEAVGGPTPPEVTAAELARRLTDRERGADEFVLLDVREPGEREVVRIPGDISIPLGAVRAGAHEALPGGIPVLVYCKVGTRSAEAVAILRGRGVDARNVAGGVLAWVSEVDPSLPGY